MMGAMPRPGPASRSAGGASYTDPATGITVDAKARTLLAHDDADYREWGASGSVRIDPGAEGRGLSLTLAPAWGADSGGAERLWRLRDARGLAPDAEPEAGSRLEAEVGYGFSVFGDRGVSTPYVGLSRSETSETLSLGQRLRLGGDLELSLDAMRREAANDDAPEHSIALRARLRW